MNQFVSIYKNDNVPKTLAKLRVTCVCSLDTFDRNPIMFTNDAMHSQIWTLSCFPSATCKISCHLLDELY